MKQVIIRLLHLSRANRYGFQSMTSCAVMLLMGLSLILAGCQTRLDRAGADHKLVAAKWYALAKYADSAIRHYGVTVTAQLAIDKIDNKAVFRLHNVKLSQRENFRNINLLQPTFEQKYLCLPQCFQLLEYDDSAGNDGATLLSEYFATHEFELFKFYGDLVLLAERLETLAQQNGLLFEAYIHALAESEQRFDSTQAFIAFLDTALSDAGIEQFEADPGYAYARFMADYLRSPEQDWADEPRNSPGDMQGTRQDDDAKSALDPQADWLQSTEIPAEQVWTALSESELDSGGRAKLAPEAVWLNEQDLSQIEQANEVMNWQQARRLTIAVGINVCSYANNMFGSVTAITADAIQVSLMGQAKNVADGVIADLASGALFENHTELYFLPMSGMQTFSKSDLAVCYLQ